MFIVCIVLDYAQTINPEITYIQIEGESNEEWNPSLYDLVILSQAHDVYNVMLVLWKGDFAMRFGVGVFEVSAWPGAHEVLRHIILD
jgi:hypothetical protein